MVQLFECHPTRWQTKFITGWEQGNWLFFSLPSSPEESWWCGKEKEINMHILISLQHRKICPCFVIPQKSFLDSKRPQSSCRGHLSVPSSAPDLGWTKNRKLLGNKRHTLTGYSLLTRILCVCERERFPCLLQKSTALFLPWPLITKYHFWATWPSRMRTRPGGSLQEMRKMKSVFEGVVMK